MPLAPPGEDLLMDTLLTARYLSLHTSTPPVNELVGNGYNREPATFLRDSGGDPTVYKNSTVMQFGPAEASWGTVTHFGIWSAPSGGQLLAYGPVGVAKSVAIDDVVRWDIGALVVDTD